jgi:hypothetical protein
MATLTIRRTPQCKPPKCGDYWIRLRVPAFAREDAWELGQTASYYGGVEVCDCCFAFANEEQRSAALDILWQRFGPEYSESVDVSEIDPGTRLLFIACEDESFQRQCRFFANRGYLASQASNWTEAMDILRHWEPDVAVVKDDMLWGGIEQVRKRERDCAALATTPVVLIGDGSGGEGSMSCLPFPVIACFREQVPLDRLLNTIRSVVSARPDSKRDAPAPALGVQ